MNFVTNYGEGVASFSARLGIDCTVTELADAYIQAQKFANDFGRWVVERRDGKVSLSGHDDRAMVFYDVAPGEAHISNDETVIAYPE